MSRLGDVKASKGPSHTAASLENRGDAGEARPVPTEAKRAEGPGSGLSSWLPPRAPHLEEGRATHSRFVPGEPPWTEGPGGLQSIGSPRVAHDRATEHVPPLHSE